MFWLTWLLFGIPCILLWDYLNRKRRNDMLHYMPGPTALPLLGNALLYRGLDSETVLDYSLQNCKKYGKIYRVWILNQLAIFSTDPRDVEVILSSTQHITKNNLYNLLHAWLGTGLIMSTGRKWHTRRKIITPTFHFKILEQFVSIFEQQGCILVQQLKKHADGTTPFNIYPIICCMALDVIAETAMGTKINAQLNPLLPYARAVFELGNMMTDRFIKPWQMHDWLFRLVEPKLAKQQDALIKTMHDFTDTIIKKRREELVNNQPQKELTGKHKDIDVLGQKHRMALLDVLLQSTVNSEPLTNEDIREEVDTFMFAGHDTTTTGISFCLYEIARHAVVQQRLVQEINDVLGRDPERPATLRDLNELKYLECVIKETLRLHPPVPFIGRNFTEDVEIRGQWVPAGTNYTVGIYSLLRDANEFEDPEEFRPERFSNDEEQKQPHPYSYIPFSAGPRNCIGQKYAILEMISIVSKVLQSYEVLPLGPAPRPMVSLVLRSVNGVHVAMRPRPEM